MKSGIALVLMCVAWLAGSQSAAQAQAELVRMNDYPGIGNMAGRVAVANKYCEKYGIRCRLTPVNAAPVAVQTLLSGEFDVAYGPAEIGIQAAAKGADLKAIGGGFVLPPFYLVVRSDVELPNLAKGYPAVMQDLRGKRVGVPGRGTGAEFHLVELLKGAGMAANDISIIVAGPPATTYPSLVNNQIEAAMSYDPMGAFCSVLKTCRMVVDPRQGQGPPTLLALSGAAGIYYARADYARAKPQVIAALQNALRDGTAFAQDPANFDALKQIIGQTFKVAHPQSEAIVDAAVKSYASALKFEFKPEALQASADYLESSGQMSKHFDTSALLLGR